MLPDPISWTRIALSGYMLTVLLETPVLYWGLSSRYTANEKLLAGALLTACSYPFVAVVFPLLINPFENYTNYIIVSEVFAPLSECIIFAFLFQRSKKLSRKWQTTDWAVIVLANLVSYLAGELMKSAGLRLS